MKLTSFEVQKFKGIGNLKISFNNTPSNGVYTLVGINESGKTTILEALNYYEYNDEKELNKISNAMLPSHDDIIPIKNWSNFNDEIIIKATHQLDNEDKEDLVKYLNDNCNFVLENDLDEITTIQKYKYRNSKFNTMESTWTLPLQGKLKDSRSKKVIDLDKENWQKAVNHLKERMPKILYFPTTLFDFPDRIYLNKETEEYKDAFYKDVIQDILDSLNENLNIKEHIVDRILNGTSNDKSNVQQITLKMGKQLSNVILKEWSSVLGNKANQISTNIDKDDIGVYIEFLINDEDGYFKLSERSLGFRWFFVFLLLTQFRGFRRNEYKQVIFLFDEPAANLSRKAQKQLLNSLEKISNKCTIIYTTHSQYLINPHWLEEAYIVTNKALEDNDDGFVAHNTDIEAYRYREFVSKFPQKTSYFQPILDVLEYIPNELEMCDNTVLLEGKNDYYTLNYFFKIILNKNDIFLIPGMSCNSIDDLISLYSGWGKNFVVLLDSDKAAIDSKKRYIEKFGPLVNNKLYTLKDINNKWTKTMESILPNNIRYEIQKLCYPDSKKYTKNMYNKTIQELLMKKQKIDIEQDIINKFEGIYNYLIKKI